MNHSSSDISLHFTHTYNEDVPTVHIISNVNSCYRTGPWQSFRMKGEYLALGRIGSCLQRQIKEGVP